MIAIRLPKGPAVVRLPLLSLVVLALATSACRADVPVVAITATPSELFSTPSASETPTDPGSPSATDTPSPTEPTERPATDTDRARFVASFAPDGASGLQHVSVDLDADDEEEVVFMYVLDAEVAHIDVAWWDGTAYEIVYGDDGGPATSVDRLRVSDVNADGFTEIVTYQSGSASAASVSLWQVTAPREVDRLIAVDGCHDGSHTYGVVGARLEDRDADGADEIYATCDDAPLPVSEWSTDRYQWREGAYRHSPELVS